MLSLQREVSCRDLEFSPAYQAWSLNGKKTETMEKRKRSREVVLVHALIKLAVCL